MKAPGLSDPTAALTLADLGSPPLAYQQLQNQLRRVGWLCQGSVVSRPLIRLLRGQTVKKGPYYLWTCKVKGKTLCVALSKAQHHVLAQAIANNRRLQRTIERMQALSFNTVLKKVPGVRKRK